MDQLMSRKTADDFTGIISVSEEGVARCLVCRKQFNRKLQISLCHDYSGNCGGYGSDYNNHGEEETISATLKNIPEAFRVFGKLLGVEEEIMMVPKVEVVEGDEDEDRKEENGGPPCCEECSKAILSVMRLQELIEKYQAIQFEHLEMLKNSLVDGNDEGDNSGDEWSYYWSHIRNLLVDSLQQGRMGDVKKALDSESVKKVKIENGGTISSFQKRKRKRKTGNADAEGRTGLVRKRANNRGEDVAQQSRPKSTCNFARKRTKRTSMGRNELATKLRNKIKNQKKTHLNFFYLLSENLLMLRYTPVKYMYQVGFTCLDCSATVEGTDYLAFQKLKAHIVESHPNGYTTEENENSRPCPVCNEPIVASDAALGVSMRKHIFTVHHPTFTACESCWRPVKPCSMIEHCWRHKSKEERGAESNRLGKRDILEPRAKADLKCHLCGKQLGSSQRLREHVKTHMPKELRETLECPECHVKFLTKLSLDRHLFNKHNATGGDDDAKGEADEEQPMSCHVCSKQFHWKDKNAYRRHLKIHNVSGEKPYQCEVCGKKFHIKDYLDKHTKVVHTSGKTFQCELCAKVYKCSISLRKHQRDVHSGSGSEPVAKAIKRTKKPIPCPFCEKIYFRRPALKSHIQRCHPEAAVEATS